MLVRLLLVIIVCLTVARPVVSAPLDDATVHLDSLFTILETNQRLMGQVSIRKGDRVVYERAFGFRDSTTAGWARSDLDTRFRIGSVTKPFTAVLAYQLMDAGKLALDSRLSLYFPKMTNADRITVKDLLGHTSGLPDFTHGMDPMVALDRAAILERIASQPAMFEPGTKRRYSNSNYVLLGYIIEAVAERPYAAQLRDGIIEKSELERTRYGGAVAPEDNDSRAYFFDNSRWMRQHDHVIENAGAAGGIVSTASDLTRFLAALFGGRLISAQTLGEMLSGYSDGTVKSGKGLSPFSIPDTGKTGFSHDGSIGAHSAVMGCVPGDSLALALTINGHNYPRNRVFFAVWDILYERKTPLPSFTPVTLPDAVAVSLEGSYEAKDYGLNISVRRVGRELEAHVSADDVFPMTYVGRYRFLFEPAGIMIDFARPEGKTSPKLTLYQQHAAIPLVRVEAK
jgi:CubicO group peptidase (beta-lactamase class C family)